MTEDVDLANRICFVVGPIGVEGSETRKRSDLLLRFIIKPALSAWPDLKIVRADSISKPGMIDGQIISSLRDAALVIADLATSNPNAFYEIGIRHMVAKPIVHMQQAAEQIPFDVSLYRAVIYSMESVEGIDKGISELAAQVGDALSPNHEVDNPVTRALGQVRFAQSALPEMELLRGEIASLRAAVQPLLDAKSAEAKRKIVEALLRPPKDGNSLSEIGALFADDTGWLSQLGRKGPTDDSSI